MNLDHAKRKNEHLSLAEKFYQPAHQEHPFDQVRLIPNALPEMAPSEVDPATSVAGLHLQWPFYFEAMTGGSQQAKVINAALSNVAQQTDLAIATGSLSTMFKLPQFNDSFSIVRTNHPTGIVIANLSAKATVQKAQQAIDLLQADALEIHLNVAQETVMPEGDRDFHWLNNIKKLVQSLSVPVIVKEVGFGMSKETLHQLQQIGVQTVNVSGRGGTNFVQIEDRRNHDQEFTDLHDWGLTTPEALFEAHAVPNIQVIASGGVSSPLDVIKAGVLGAHAVGVAGFFLHKYYTDGENGLLATVKDWQTEIVRIMTMLSCRHFDELSKVPYVLKPQLLSYIQQRKLEKGTV